MIANYKKVRFCPNDNPMMLASKDENASQLDIQQQAKQSSCENLTERRYTCSKVVHLLSGQPSMPIYPCEARYMQKRLNDRTQNRDEEIEY